MASKPLALLEGDTLRLRGVLDRAAVIALWPQLQALPAKLARLELGEVERVDSAGLALLAELASRARKAGHALAISGALLFSFLGFTTLNIYSQVGLITLVGLVSKNGILIVEFANHLQERGKEKLAAIIEAAGTRLRPILMTSFTMMSTLQLANITFRSFGEFARIVYSLPVVETLMCHSVAWTTLGPLPASMATNEFSGRRTSQFAPNIRLIKVR